MDSHAKINSLFTMGTIIMTRGFVMSTFSLVGFDNPSGNLMMNI